MREDIKIVTELVGPELGEGESIVKLVLAEPYAEGRADYYVRYKVFVGKINGSATGVDDLRCLVAKISSNTGKPSFDVATCESVQDVV